MKGKKLIITVTILIILVGGVFGTYFMQNSAYIEAVQLYEEKQYEEAKNTFENISNFKNSTEMIEKCEVMQAIQMLDGEDYIQGLDKLGNEKINDEMLELIYTSAYNNMSFNKFNECREILNFLSKYRDVQDIYQECNYLDAIHSYENNDYERAIILFTQTSHINFSYAP